MKDSSTYQLYKVSLDQLRQLKSVQEGTAWRLWAWRFTFSMFFVMCTFTLLVSIIDDGLLFGLLSALSDDPRFTREGTEVLRPFFQLGLVIVILVLLWVNQLELKLRNREKQLAEQEKLIKEINQHLGA